MSFLGDIAQQKCGYKIRIKMEDLMQKYPDGVSINWIDKLPNKAGGTFYAYSFDEDNSATFTAGTAMSDLVDEWIEKAGSLEAVNKYLKKEGSEKFKFVKTRPQTGRTYIKPMHIADHIEQIDDDDVPWNS